MKLSEAMKMGAMLKPHGHRGYFDGFSTCALGAAADAIGRLDDLIDGRFLERDEWQLLRRVVTDPITRKQRSVWEVVTSLNDQHGWTREQIADQVKQWEQQYARPQPVDAGDPVEARCEVGR